MRDYVMGMKIDGINVFKSDEDDVLIDKKF